MIRRPPRSTRTDTLFPYTTLFRSAGGCSTGSVPPPSLTDTHCLAQLPTELVGLRPDPETKEGGARILRPDAALTAVPVEGAALSDKPCPRSEEHTSELQSLMRTSYAVFCFKKKKRHQIQRSP